MEDQINKLQSKKKQIITKKLSKKKKHIGIQKPRYIHEVISQETLLRNAIHQEHLNKISLVKMMP